MTCIKERVCISMLKTCQIPPTHVPVTEGPVQGSTMQLTLGHEGRCEENGGNPKQFPSLLS